MKKVLSVLALAALMLPALLHAQITTFPWTEGFENGATGWTIVDSDNDGITWQLSDTSSQIASFRSEYPRTGNACMIALSFNNIEPYGALTPDEWLISPAIAIPAGTNYNLTFYDNGTNTEYPAEHYAVYVATANTVTALSATTPLMEQTLSSELWIKRTVNLSAYAGQTIYIGFRHYNCTDQFVMGLDDIRIGGPESPEITVNAPKGYRVGVPATFSIVGVANSFGWYVDGTAQTTTDSVLTHTFTTAGSHTVVATATNAAGTTYDTLTFNVLDCTGSTTLPFTASFTDGLGCWDTAGTTLYGYNWLTSDESGAGIGQVISFSRVYSNQQWYNLQSNSWLISPSMAMPAAGGYEIAWQVRPYNATYFADTYKVYVISGSDTTEVFNETLTADTNFQQRVAGIPASVNGSNFKIAFLHMASTAGYVMVLDNIQVRTLTAPVLTLSGPASGRTGDALTYTANSNATSFAWTVDGVTDSETSNTLTTTFTTAGNHIVKVVASNNSGSTTDSISTNIVSCDNITTFPYVLDFEDTIVLGCYNLIDADNDGMGWQIATGTVGNTAETYGYNSNSSLISASYDNATNSALHPDNWVVSPAMEIPAGSNFTLSWWVRSFGSQQYSHENYSVYISTSSNTGDMTTPVFNEITPMPWTKHVVDMSNYAGQTVYVAFRHHNCTDQNYMAIDDIRVGAQEPPEVSLVGPSAARTTDSVHYTATSTATSFAWTVDGTAIANTASTFDTMFATVGTHTVVVSSTNAAGTSSDTIVTNIFSCENITLPYTATFGSTLGCFDTVNYATHGYGWYPAEGAGIPGQVYSMSATNGYFGLMDVNVDNWMIGPEIAIPTSGTYEVAWSVRPYTSNYSGDHYGVYAINGNDTVELFSESLTADTTFAARTAVIPTTMAGSNVRVAFRHYNSVNGYVIILNDIMIRELSSAPVVTLQGPTSAEAGQPVTFTAICGNATSFTWTVDGVAESETTNTLTTTFTTAGNHIVKVVAANAIGNNEDSLTVNVYDCDAISSFPYTQDFEGDLQCWDAISMTSDNDNLFGISDSAYTGSHSFGFSSYNRSTDYNQYLISPELQLPDGNFQVKFMYKAFRPADKFQVLASSTDKQIASFSVIDNVSESNTEWTSVVFNLPAGTKYVAINYYGNYQYYLWVDDITIGQNLGINNASIETNVNIYPNPVHSMLNIEGIGIQSVDLIDINGRVVLSSNRGGQLDISSLAEGVYMVRIVTSNGVSTSKVVKK